jgi:CRP-like cAMP-binding protein
MHTSTKDVPGDVGLRVAKEGVKNTMSLMLAVGQRVLSEPLEILDLFSKIPFFSSLPLRCSTELLQATDIEEYAAGEKLISFGERGAKFFVVMSGVVKVYVPDRPRAEKRYTVGDFFGEGAIIENRPTAANCVAGTDVKVAVLERDFFLFILRGTGVIQMLKHLTSMRKQPTWELLIVRTHVFCF